MIHRLRKDFRLSLIILLGACGVLGLGPFAIYRLVIGDLVMATVDILLVASIVTAVLYAWRTGDTRRAGIFLVLLNTGMAILVTHLVGIFGLFWLYVVMLSNYFLAPVKIAVAATLTSLTIILAMGTGLDGLPEILSFVITAGITSLFAFIFATRSDSQRQQLEKLATIDPLTGAGNRLALEGELEIAIASLKRHGQAQGLMMLDLDYFKSVNDTHGHAVGDRILRDFARLMENHSRREDRLFRFGGEEFVVLIADTDHQGLKQAAEHIRQSMEEHLASPSGPVTVSVGAALLQAGETWESWLRRADHALYQAKAEGRNRAIVAPSTL